MVQTAALGLDCGSRRGRCEFGWRPRQYGDWRVVEGRGGSGHRRAVVDLYDAPERPRLLSADLNLCGAGTLARESLKRM